MFNTCLWLSSNLNLTEIVLFVGIQLYNWCTESLIISGFFSNCAPYPSFKAHFCGHPQFRSTPSQYLIKINVRTYNLNIYVCMYLTELSI